MSERTLREVARLRRTEMEREADLASIETEHDVELLERLQSLRGPAVRWRSRDVGARRAA